MRKSTVRSMLVGATALIFAQFSFAAQNSVTTPAADIAANYKVSVKARNLKKQFAKFEWLAYQAAKTDTNGSYIIINLASVNGPEKYKGYFATNGKDLFIITRNRETLQPEFIEGVVQVSTVASLRKQGFHLRPSEQYGDPQPTDRVFELAWLRHPYPISSHS